MVWLVCACSVDRQHRLGVVEDTELGFDDEVAYELVVQVVLRLIHHQRFVVVREFAAPIRDSGQ